MTKIGALPLTKLGALPLTKWGALPPACGPPRDI